MKIIKHGKKPEPIIFRFECKKCGCVFEATNEECDEISATAIFGLNKITSYSIECPECGERVEVDV